MSDFAPRYSIRERILIALKILAVAAPVYVAGYYWLFPKLRDYVKVANCDYFGDITGLQLLMYGVFVLLPVSMALLIWLSEGARCLRVWRLGQSPLPGEKVLRKTRYKYGTAARVRTLLVLAIVVLLLGGALWGGFQAREIIRQIGPCDASLHPREAWPPRQNPQQGGA